MKLLWKPPVPEESAPVPSTIPGWPLPFIAWYSCPQAVAPVHYTDTGKDVIWFVTNSMGNAEVGVNDTLYIIEYDIETTLFSIIYQKDFVTTSVYAEPEIMLKSLNGITVLLLVDVNRTYIEYFVFTNKTLSSNDQIITGNVGTEIDPFDINPHHLIILDNGVICFVARFWILPDYDSQLFACCSSNNGATWTFSAIGTLGDYYDGLALTKNLSSLNELWLFGQRDLAFPLTATPELWKSTDNGATWTLVNANVSQTVTSYYYDEALLVDGSLVVLGTGYTVSGGTSHSTGIVVSNDSGITFTAMTILRQLVTGNADYNESIGILKCGTKYFIAAGWQHYDINGYVGLIYIWESINGTTWTLNTTIDAHKVFQYASFETYEDIIVFTCYYASTVYQGTARMMAFWLSEDGGATWTAKPINMFMAVSGGTTPVYPPIPPDPNLESTVLQPTSATFDSNTHTGTISVFVSPSSVIWNGSVISGGSWLTITNLNPQTGNGTINYSMTANTGALRTGTISVNGVICTITQLAPTAPPSGTIALTSGTTLKNQTAAVGSYKLYSGVHSGSSYIGFGLATTDWANICDVIVSYEHVPTIADYNAIKAYIQRTGANYSLAAGSEFNGYKFWFAITGGLNSSVYINGINAVAGTYYVMVVNTSGAAAHFWITFTDV